MKEVYLQAPSASQLFYRQNWMQEPKTMAYNAGYELASKGYNQLTGTIFKTEKEMRAWHRAWEKQEPERYFAYIYEKEGREPIGEVYYYPDGGLHSMGILIQEKYRGKGFSVPALLALERVAFEKNGISELSDFIPLDRHRAVCAFKKAGFVHTDKTRRELVFGKARIARQLLITREMYAAYKATAFPCGGA